MIFVVVDQTGDNAEATTVEDAMIAARTLLEDARGDRPLQGFRLTVTFYVDGAAVLGAVSQPAIWRAIGMMRFGR